MKMDSMKDEGARLTLGVDRLNQVSSQVDSLKSEALEQQKLLNDKRQEANEAFQMIMNSMHASEDKKGELEELQNKIQSETGNLKGI